MSTPAILPKHRPVFDAIPETPPVDVLNDKIQGVCGKILQESHQTSPKSPNRPSPRKILAERMATGLSLSTPSLSDQPPARNLMADLDEAAASVETDPGLSRPKLSRPSSSSSLFQTLTNAQAAGAKHRPSSSASSSATESSSALQEKAPQRPLAISTKPLHTKTADSKIKAQFIESCKTSFFKFAQKYSSKGNSLKHVDFEPCFSALKTVLLAMKDRAFLDAYLVRDSQVGTNRNPEMQAALTKFHSNIETLVRALNAVGIEGVKADQPISFWSGQEGQRRASEEDEALADSDVPLFKYLFECWNHIKLKELKDPHQRSEMTTLLPILFSAMFAAQAKGEVNVYMASKNDPDADHSIINVDSAFWSSELYHLMNNQEVSKINVYLHVRANEQGDQVWCDPIDLKSQDPQTIRYRDAVLHFSKRNDHEMKVSMSLIRTLTQKWKEYALKKA